MRRIAMTFATAALLASAFPASADDGHGRGHEHRRAAPPPRRYAYARRYHEGQYWHGHRLTYRSGHWGYYAPRRGASVFISIPL